MPLNSLATDAFGVFTISLVFLTALLGLICIFHSLYFQLWTRRKHHRQFSFFNGPWISRIILILVSIWWGFGEIFRSTFLKSRLFSSHSWQKYICKFYILSNLGFAEPIMFMMISFLLHAALQKRESGTLNQQWNRKTLGYVLLFCFPNLFMQAVVVLVGPRFINEEKSDMQIMILKFSTCVYSSKNGETVCTYPLLSIVVLGGFYALLISYITLVGARILYLVINKVLRRRIYVLITSLVIFLPLRALLLGVSMLPSPGNLLYEAIVFLAFLILLYCTVVGICMLVYLPVADSLALTDIDHIKIEGMPYNDYYYQGQGDSLITNQSIQRSSSSDESAKHDSISFCNMILDGLASEDIIKTRFSDGPTIAMSSVSPPPPGRSIIPLRELAAP
ncbi:hypothetical protein Cni_G12836 [Canna indica]|uniref:Uncharacterized protein n=1 Tax=Canna indica TaxID=4628 RepID=A0AAQ3KAN5_9LILI|nr:hypothetical protein Cni_G12836 [Canna indica]